MAKPPMIVKSRAEWQVLEPGQVLPFGPKAYQESHDFMCADLERSGLCPEDMNAKPARHLKFPRIPAYYIPYHKESGHAGRVRLDFSHDEEKLYGKYRSAVGETNVVYLPPTVLPGHMRSAATKYMCEGEKKACALRKRFPGIHVMSLPGCSMWSVKGSKERVLLPEIQELMSVRAGRETKLVYIADADIMNLSKVRVRTSALKLKAALAHLHISCDILYPPDGYKGVDDWLVMSPDVTLEDMLVYDGVMVDPMVLVARGAGAKPNKDGSISFAGFYPDNHNSEVIAKYVLEQMPDIVSYDYIRGYVFEDGEIHSEPMNATMHFISYINQLCRGMRLVKEVVAACLIQHFNPLPNTSIIKDYVATLQWDKVPRLKTWVTDLIELKPDMDPDYANRLGIAMIAGLCERIMNPGCQCDFMFTLCGPQGVGKSTFSRTLASFPAIDIDGHQVITYDELKRTSSTDFISKAQRALVMDLDDNNLHRRQDADFLKNAITQVKDSSRILFTALQQVTPRHFIFMSSSNHDQVLTDLTGSRRFAIIRMKSFKRDGSIFRWTPAIRDQLLAEYLANRSDYEDWWDIPVMVMAKNNQAATVSDPVLDAINEMIVEDCLINIKGVKYITATAIAKWLDRPEWLWSERMVGRMLQQVILMPEPLLGERKLIRLPVNFWESLPPDITNRYRTANKVSQIWAYPVL